MQLHFKQFQRKSEAPMSTATHLTPFYPHQRQTAPNLLFHHLY